MSIEGFAQFVFKRLRLPLFLGLLAAGPFCAGVFLLLEKQSVDMLYAQHLAGKTKVKTAVARKERRERFMAKRVNADSYFLNKKLEELPFLTAEKEELNNWLAHPAVSNKEPLQQRLRFLETGNNHLVFREDDVQLSKLYKETIEKQQDSVEMDEMDLKNLLSIIEELPANPLDSVGRAQLIISEFSLHKKRTFLQKEVIEVKMDLFKREFLSP